MAHQLNTDYLRRKLLNPQRQVFFLINGAPFRYCCQFFFLPSPLPRIPEIRAATILITHSNLTYSLPLLVAIQFTTPHEQVLLLYKSSLITCHIICCSLLLWQSSWSFELAYTSADHLAPKLPGENYSQQLTAHKNKIHHPSPQPFCPFSPSTRL